MFETTNNNNYTMIGISKHYCNVGNYTLKNTVIIVYFSVCIKMLNC